MAGRAGNANLALVPQREPQRSGGSSRRGSTENTGHLAAIWPPSGHVRRQQRRMLLHIAVAMFDMPRQRDQKYSANVS
jgi:hypothetical protein